jgi:hypothetical protein
VGRGQGMCGCECGVWVWGVGRSGAVVVAGVESRCMQQVHCNVVLHSPWRVVEHCPVLPSAPHLPCPCPCLCLCPCSAPAPDPCPVPAPAPAPAPHLDGVREGHRHCAQADVGEDVAHHMDDGQRVDARQLEGGRTRGEGGRAWSKGEVKRQCRVASG